MKAAKVRARETSMRISPHYEEIKASALKMMRSEAYLAEMAERPTLKELCRPGNAWVLKNAVGVALCQARDEVTMAHNAIYRHGGFNTGNFQKAEREIIKLLRREVQAGPAV